MQPKVTDIKKMRNCIYYQWEGNAMLNMDALAKKVSPYSKKANCQLIKTGTSGTTLRIMT